MISIAPTKKEKLTQKFLRKWKEMEIDSHINCRCQIGKQLKPPKTSTIAASAEAITMTPSPNNIHMSSVDETRISPTLKTPLEVHCSFAFFQQWRPYRKIESHVKSNPTNTEEEEKTEIILM